MRDPFEPYPPWTPTPRECPLAWWHGANGVSTVLVETGTVPVVEPVTTIRLDTPGWFSISADQLLEIMRDRQARAAE